MYNETTRYTYLLIERLLYWLGKSIIRFLSCGSQMGEILLLMEADSTRGIVYFY